MWKRRLALVHPTLRVYFVLREICCGLNPYSIEKNCVLLTIYISSTIHTTFMPNIYPKYCRHYMHKTSEQFKFHQNRNRFAANLCLIHLLSFIPFSVFNWMNPNCVFDCSLKLYNIEWSWMFRICVSDFGH